MLSRMLVSQRGVTIIELMVGMTVGLIVVGMVLSVYLTTVRSSGDTLSSSRLNQEMGAIMSIMVNDIRRAGYANPAVVNKSYDWDDPLGVDPDDVDNIEEPTTNPFNLPGSTALEVHDNMTDDNDVMTDGDPNTTAGSCILYAYDASNGDDDANAGDTNGDGYRIRENDEFFGFRRDDTDDTVQMRTSVDVGAGGVINACNGENQVWARLNDPNLVIITDLSFDLFFSSCINVSEPDIVDNDGDGYPAAGAVAGDIDPEMDEVNCYDFKGNGTVPAPGSEAKTVERRDVEITMTGQLADDASVQITMVQRVSVRNDLIRVR